MKYVWEFQSFAALTAPKLHEIYAARQAVFIVEQKCPYQDADAYDPLSHHLCGWSVTAEGQRELLAYLRIVPPDGVFVEPSIGRVITTAAGRGQGLGRELLRRGVAATVQLYPAQPIRISAQHYLELFYQRFGFVTVSDVYIEDGIPHIAMLRPA
jgi:ElaA protein